MGTCMIIQDNFLNLHHELMDDLLNLKNWKDLNTKATPYAEHLDGDYSWWDGITKPKNVWEKLINLIWIKSFELDVSKISGFEYWCNQTSAGDELDWHQDKDELLYEQKKITVCPKISTVYYGFPHKVNGGYLEIAKEQEDNDIEVERIEPVYNRLVIFDPSLWHRVAPIRSGYRYGFQVNIWEKKPSFLPQDTHRPSQDI